MRAVSCILCGSFQLKTRFRTLNFSVLQCAVCSLIFKSTVLDENSEEIESAYNSETYWQIPNRQDGGINYDPQHSKIKLYRRDLQRLTKLIPRKGRLLDVGCAKGVFLDVARKEGWQPLGLELSAWASQYARDHFKLEVFTGKLENAPWSDASLDVITLFDVIEHLVDPAEIIAKSNRLIKPNGLLVVKTPNANSILHRMAGIVFRLSRGVISWPLHQIYGLGKGGHIVFFTPQTLIALLNQHGFNVQEVHFDAVNQGLWRPATDVERLAGLVDNIFGKLQNTKYHMVVYARKVN